MQNSGIIYGASSIRSFVTDEVFKRNIIVTSAASANGASVAEYTLAMITLSLKNAWPYIKGLERDKDKRTGRGGMHDAVIGIIGASSVGRHLIRLLKGYSCRVLVYDPFVDAAEARHLGVEKYELDELMSRSDIVTLHAPNLPQLRHMIGADQLALMQDGSVFINTARGALVDETALIRELQTGRISACLDVTDPEPPEADSPLYTLPNVILTPHLAGALDLDTRRIGRQCLEELKRYLDNQAPLNPISAEAYKLSS